MTCQPLTRGYEIIGTICGRGPTEVIYRESLDIRWCFVCRKRVEFELTVTRDVEPSYYDPNPSIQCVPRNHHSGDLFPGRERTWEDDQ